MSNYLEQLNIWLEKQHRAYHKHDAFSEHPVAVKNHHKYFSAATDRTKLSVTGKKVWEAFVNSISMPKEAAMALSEENRKAAFSYGSSQSILPSKREKQFLAALKSQQTKLPIEQEKPVPKEIAQAPKEPRHGKVNEEIQRRKFLIPEMSRIRREKGIKTPFEPAVMNTQMLEDVYEKIRKE